MIRKGQEYIDKIDNDGRQIYMDGEKIEHVSQHPAFSPIVNIRARIYDMAHEDRYHNIMSYTDETDGARNCIAFKPPLNQGDWLDKRKAVETVMADIGGVVIRVADETIGEMWSLYDGQDVLNSVDAQFSKNIKRHIEIATKSDCFHVSANTDPKGDRSKAPQEQDPDMLLHVVKETDSGIIVRGAKYETASAYSDQAFVKPTIGAWRNNEKLSNYAVGFICQMNAPGLKHICRSGFAGRTNKQDYPLANNFDEVDSLIIFDDVFIPWEDILFYRHTEAAAFIRSTLHRYSAFPFVLRILLIADMMIGAALLNVRQTGLDKNQAVREKLATMAVYREGINAYLSASIAQAEESPGGLLMPNQSLLYSGRVHACSNLPAMMHIARELCGGQICLTPNQKSFVDSDDSSKWLKKFYSINEQWDSDDRRKLLAFARDLLNSDYAGHRLTFQLFAQSPPFAHLAAVYNNFNFSETATIVKKAAGLSDKIMDK